MRQGNLDARIKALRAQIALLEGQATTNEFLGPSFVLRPGVAPNAPNVFSTFGALYAAGKNIQGPVAVLVDPRSAPAHLTAGSYVLDNWRFTAEQSSADFTLHIDPGVSIDSSFLSFAVGIIVSSEAPVSPFTPSTFFILSVEGDLSTIQSTTGNAPFVHMTAASDGGIIQIGEESVFGDGTNNAATIDAGQTLVMSVGGAFGIGGTVRAHAIGGAGNLNVGLDANSNVSTVQDNTGTRNFFKNASAANLAYTAAVLANWSGTNPSSTQNALDRIAAKITPIP